MGYTFGGGMFRSHFDPPGAVGAITTSQPFQMVENHRTGLVGFYVYKDQDVCVYTIHLPHR